MDLKNIHTLLNDLPATETLPTVFIGHGSPANVLAHNEFTQSLASLGTSLPVPQAILVVSAHWITKGTFVSVSKKPETIYDFYGFPEEMYKITYPAPGASEWAKKIPSLVQHTKVEIDEKMGLDHGAWTVLRHMYPKANVPVFQLSIDMSKPMEYHYQIGRELRGLRKRGVLILGSGNIVHNLRLVDWRGEDVNAFDWAIEFDEFVKKNLNAGNHQPLLKYDQQGSSARQAVPTNDHYIPMIYILGLQEKNEDLQFTFEGFQYASVSMRCFKIG